MNKVTDPVNTPLILLIYVLHRSSGIMIKQGHSGGAQGC